MRQNGFAQHHSSGRLAPFLTGRRSFDGVGALLQIDHPEGDYSRPAVDELALICLRSDRLSLQTDFGAGRATFTATSGAIFLAPMGVAPTIITYDPHRLSCLAISTERLAAYSEAGLVRDYGHLHHRSFRSPLLTALIDQMWEHARHDDAATRLFADGAAMVVAAELSRLSVGSAPRLQGGLSPRQLDRAIEALRSGENRSVAEIANDLGLSAPHFNRAFRVSVGISPHAYRMRTRMETAKALLAETDATVAEIAARLGYADPSYFVRRFTIVTGMTAAAFRRAHARGNVARRDPRSTDGY